MYCLESLRQKVEKSEALDELQKKNTLEIIDLIQTHRNNNSTKTDLMVNFNLNTLSTAEDGIQSALDIVETWYHNAQEYKVIEDLYDEYVKSARSWYDIKIKFVLETVLSQLSQVKK